MITYEALTIIALMCIGPQHQQQMCQKKLVTCVQTKAGINVAITLASCIQEN